MKAKTIKLTLYTPEVIKIINDLPRGSRSLVVESALLACMQTDAGNALLGHLQHRGSKGKKEQTTHHNDKASVLSDMGIIWTRLPVTIQAGVYLGLITLSVHELSNI